jgi:hypothetical protein
LSYRGKRCPWPAGITHMLKHPTLKSHPTIQAVLATLARE